MSRYLTVAAILTVAAMHLTRPAKAHYTIRGPPPSKVLDSGRADYVATIFSTNFRLISNIFDSNNRPQ
jgi:hypothetical protein